MSFPHFSVLPGHELAYNEIATPHRRWAFSYYFLYRWLPLLHPQQAMLIQLLRQATWRDGKPTGHCQLSNGVLCRMMGWSETSHKSLLNELERPFSDWFMRRQRSRKRHVTQGHAVEGAPSYRLQMDDPLTPNDQVALRALLSSVRPSTPYQAAEWLSGLAARHTRALWEQLDEFPTPDTLPAKSTTLLALARHAWPHLWDGSPEALDPLHRAAEQLQLRITGAGYAHMELDYLRRSWLPTLGINPTWLVIILRARCFHDPTSNETRDVVTISRKALQDQMAIPDRTFRRILRDDALIPLFLTSAPGVAADPQEPRAMPHRGNVAFSVAYPLLPVAPADLAQYHDLLLSQSLGSSEDSTSGQVTRQKAASPPISSEKVIPNPPLDPAHSGHSTLLDQSNAVIRPGSFRPLDPAEGLRNGHSAPLNAATQPDIPVSTNRQEASQFQQPEIPTTLGKGGEAELKARIEALLRPFGIKNMRAILDNDHLSIAEVRGWIARGREEVSESQIAGYLYNRLKQGSEIREWDPLPATYQRVGAITPSEEAEFEAWWVAEESTPPFIDADQAARYRAWLRLVKEEAGDPRTPDYSPRARWRREMARYA